MTKGHDFAVSKQREPDEPGVFVKAHTPIPEHLGGTEWVWLTWEDHQHQGLLQSEDFGRCFFFPGDVKKWLETVSPLPENYFELWDIFEKFSFMARSNAGKRGTQVCKERGVGVYDPEVKRRAAEAAAKVHAKKIRVTLSDGSEHVLPSVNATAEFLKVNRRTVTGYLIGQRGKRGSYGGWEVHYSEDG